MTKYKAILLLLIAMVVASCTDFDEDYDYKLSCQKTGNQFGVWQARLIEGDSRTKTLTGGKVKPLYTIWIYPNDTYKFCDADSCTQNKTRDDFGYRGAFLVGFADDPVTQPFRERVGEFSVMGIESADLDMRDMSCQDHPRNQYCENKQCRFFGDNFEPTIGLIVFVKVENY